jgi:hypothetical protein
VRRRLISLALVALAGSLLGAPIASAKRLDPSGQAVARSVGPGFPRGLLGREEVRAHPTLPRSASAVAQAKRAAAQLQGRPFAVQAPLAPAVVSKNWDGMLWSDNASYNLGTPPDTTGAIGPNYYFEFVNSVVRPYNRSTLASLGTAQLDVFTGPTGRAVFDPQVQWDQEAQRWIYAAISDDGDGTENYLLFGWSKDANASGSLTSNWCRYAINTGSQIDDYPKLGHSANHIIVGSNVFTGNTFNTARIWAIPKPANGSTTCPTTFGTPFFGSTATPLKTADNDNAFTPQPANTVAAAGGGGYVVAADDPTDHGGTANQLMLWHVGGTSTSPTLVQDGNVGVSGFGVPANVPQPSTKGLIDSSDSRLTQAVAQPDPDAAGAEAIWTQHTIAGPGGRTVVRWYELIPSQCSAGVCAAAAKRQEGTISSTTQYVFNGAISPSSAGNTAMIDFNEGSATAFVTVRVQSRVGTDALGTMGSESTLVTSTANDRDFSCSPCRWGDYAGASPDPSDSSLVWGSNQYNGTASAPPNRLGWQTRNFAIAP